MDSNSIYVQGNNNNNKCGETSENKNVICDVFVIKLLMKMYVLL